MNYRSTRDQTMERIMGKNITIERSDAAPDVELPDLRHLIGGVRVESSSGGTAEVKDPARGTNVATIGLAGPDEVEAAVQAARGALPSWAGLTPRERSESLLALADAVEADQKRLCALESLNCGKPAAVAEDDISSTVDTFRFMAGAGRAGTTIAAGEYVEDITSMILREPVGVVGMVTPWNYPLLMAAWKIAPALMVGNTAVLKPSEVTPLTALRFAELASEVLPAGVLNIVLGDGATVGRAISRHPSIDLVALTGSVRAGRDVARTAAENLTRIHLELGGKAPVVVLPDANLEKVASTVAEAGFWNSGQECGAACRVLAHESVVDDLVRRLVEKVSEYQLAEPGVDNENALGPIIYQEHYERVMAHVRSAIERGAAVETGGEGDDSQGYWVQPTVLRVVEGDPITNEEVFGPVVTVETFTDVEDAVRRANETDYGLAGSVFTENGAAAMSIAKRLDFGSVNINTHLALPTEMPWAGFKNSGHGRDLSAYALDDYSRTKHIALHHGPV